MTNALEFAIKVCEDWATDVTAQIGADGIYLFGSTVHRNGEQFTERSDLDLVVVMPRAAGVAPARCEWLVQLQKLKTQLEVRLVEVLKRARTDLPICSIVAVSAIEVESDTHKSAVRDFFQTNSFRSLASGALTPAEPLLESQPRTIAEQTRQVLQFVQEIRNQYLRVDALGTGVLPDWDDPFDPMPKPVMRYSAIARSAGPELLDAASAYDLEVGLDEISHYLYERRDAHVKYREIYHWLSVRRGARGIRTSLRPDQHLFLAEVLHDIVVSGEQSKRTVEPALTNWGLQRLLPSDSPIPVTFDISERQIVNGVNEDISIAIDEALENLRWRRSPPFSVTMLELETLDLALASIQPTTPQERRRRLEMIRRRHTVATVKPLLERGLAALIFYQNIVFPWAGSEKKQRKALIRALQSFVNRAFEPYDRGTLEAWKELENGHKLVVHFSVPDSGLHIRGRPELDDLDVSDRRRAIADRRHSVTELPQPIVGQFFVPNLLLGMMKSVARGELQSDSIDEWTYIFDLESWYFGPS